MGPRGNPHPDRVGVGGLSGERPSRISPSANGPPEVGVAQRPVGLRRDAGRCAAAGRVGREDPRPLLHRIVPFRRGPARLRGGGPLVWDNLQGPVVLEEGPRDAELRGGGLVRGGVCQRPSGRPPYRWLYRVLLRHYGPAAGPGFAETRPEGPGRHQ